MTVIDSKNLLSGFSNELISPQISPQNKNNINPNISEKEKENEVHQNSKNSQENIKNESEERKSEKIPESKSINDISGKNRLLSNFFYSY